MDSAYIFFFPIWMGYSFAWQIRINVSLDKAIALKQGNVTKLYFAKAGAYVINIAGLFGFIIISGRNLSDIYYAAAVVLGLVAYWFIARPIATTLLSEKPKDCFTRE